VGRTAAPMLLPPPLVRAQQSVRSAAAELAQLQAKHQDARRARQAAASGAEAVQLDAEVARTAADLQQAQVRLDFAQLALGRDCVTAGFAPSASRLEIEEIRRLKQQLAG
jgi:hypothetical protein